MAVVFASLGRWVAGIIHSFTICISGIAKTIFLPDLVDEHEFVM
jgi:hypothetical protein